jgi:protein transport protein SEC61 subunit alpha
MFLQLLQPFRIQFDQATNSKLQTLVTVLVAAIECSTHAAAVGQGYGSIVAVFVQFSIGTAVALGLDAVLANGYGLVSGYSLFIAVPACERIAATLMSPKTTNGQIDGMLPSLLMGQIHWPLLFALVRTSAFTVAAMWVSALRIRVPMSGKAGNKTYANISLLYHGTTPLMICQQMTAVVSRISEGLYGRYGGNLLIKLLGTWHLGTPVGGLVFIMSPVSSTLLWPNIALHTFLHASFLITSCAYIGHAWSDVAGNGASDVARRARDQGYSAVGHRAGKTPIALQRYVPTAAALGGGVIALLSVLADRFQLLVSGSNLLLTAGTAKDLVQAYNNAY